jgi:hypothetical protein
MILVGIANVLRTSNDDRYLFSLIGGIFMIVLGVASLNIGYHYIDINGDPAFHTLAQDGGEYLLYVFVAIIFGLVSLLYSFIKVYPYFTRLGKGKDVNAGFK